jgi:hypothetical protein
MGEELEARLTEAAGRLRRFQSAVAGADDLAERIGHTEQEIGRLRSTQAAEDRDVRRLEGWSLTRVVAALLGAREDRLVRERAEADAAAYRVVQAQGQLTALRRERAAVRAEIERLASAPATYEAALAEKERALEASPDPRGRRLLDLAAERGHLAELIRELREALGAADTAAEALDALDRTLGSASGWSTFDVIGGGVISSAVKHSRLDEAAGQAAYADQCLATLRAELSDVDISGPGGLSVQVSGTTRFVDVWLDNVFTDVHVAGRIAEARDNVALCCREVAMLRGRLQGRIDEGRGRLHAVDEERHALLLQ